MFDWSDIRAFLALARASRLGPAARHLRVDVATVSRRVTTLERDLQASLFNRQSAGFVLTDTGQWLLPLAEAMEQQAAAITLGPSGSTGASGRVRVAMMEGIASQYLACRVEKIRAQHPQIVIELATSPALFNLTRREADISLSFVPMRGPRLRMRKIGQFDLFLYGAPDYLAHAGAPVHRADLSQHVFVDYIEDLVQIPEVHWLLDVIREPRVVFRSSSMFAQQSAAANATGLVLLPTFAGDTDPRLVSVLRPHVHTTRPLYLAVHEDLANVPRIAAVVRSIEDIILQDVLFAGVSSG